MTATEPIRPILVFGYGNPSRGDDALGAVLIDRLAERQGAERLGHVELLTDFQLQVEHALDLRGRQRVVFVDASASGPAPFAVSRVRAERDASFTTHAMSPGAVLRVFEQTLGRDPPETWLLAVRGYAFALGTPLSGEATRNLDAAEDHLVACLAGTRELAGSR